jgi:hypothetical protein
MGSALPYVQRKKYCQLRSHWLEGITVNGKTEQTPNGLATYLSNEIRVYGQETCRTDRGTIRTFQLCEELVAGRWEGFVSILSEEPDPSSFFGQDDDGGDTILNI